MFHLLLTGREPPMGTHEIPDGGVAPVSLLRALHPTVSTVPLFRRALQEATDL